MRAIRRRLPSSLLTVTALAATVLVTTAPRADAATVERIDGGDRFDTGAKVSEYAFTDADAVETVYVATGRDFPDALAAGAAAAALPGPVLLTEPGELVERARDELRRLTPAEVVLVGGELALSDDVEQAIADDDEIGGEVRRVQGGDRFATAAAVTLDAFPEGLDTVFIATGRGFPDALAGVPAAARFDTGLLLTEKDELPEATADALRELGVTNAVLLGGTGVISFDVEQQIEEITGETDRLAGGDRFDTAAAVSAAAFRGGARTVFLATGRAFPDALTGGPAAAVFDGPLLLTEKDNLPDSTATELQALNPRTIVILGGEGAVSDEVAEAVEQALSGSSALPSGATPDFAYASVDTRADSGPRANLQTINLGTLEGNFETLTNPTEDEVDVSPVFSPNASRVAFVRQARFGTFDDEPTLHVIDVATARERQLIDLDDLDGGCGLGDFLWTGPSDALVILCLGRNDDMGTPDDSGDDEPLPNVAYLVDLRGRATPIPTPDEATEYLSAAADPSSTSVALSASDGESATIHTVDVTALDGGPTLLSTPPNVVVDLTWSADGSTIVGSIVAGGGSFFGRPDTNVIAIDAASGEGATLLPEDQARPQEVVDVTADGSSVLVLDYTFDAEASANDRLYTVATADGAVAEVVGQEDIERDWIGNAALLPDGSVVFDDLEASGSSFGGRPNRAENGTIRAVEADGSNLRDVVAVEGVISAFPSTAR